MSDFFLSVANMTSDGMSGNYYMMQYCKENVFVIKTNLQKYDI